MIQPAACMNSPLFAWEIDRSSANRFPPAQHHEAALFDWSLQTGPAARPGQFAEDLRNVLQRGQQRCPTTVEDRAGVHQNRSSSVYSRIWRKLLGEVHTSIKRPGGGCLWALDLAVSGQTAPRSCRGGRGKRWCQHETCSIYASPNKWFCW